MKNYFILNLLLILFAVFVEAQSEENMVNISGYIDTYLALDNDKLSSGNIHSTRQLTYLNPYKNQLSLNMAQIGMDISYKNVRGVLVLQAGDFVNTAFAANRNPMLQQANIGYNIFEKVWIDAGYFLTHVGGESVLPKDNWLSSHSIVTIFEPYFQSGIRASYEGEQLSVHMHLLNANGLYEDNNENKTLGIFLAYKLSDDFNISYANVIGDEETGSVSNDNIHIFHNIVAQYNISKELSIKGQIDYSAKDISTYDSLNNELIHGTYFGASFTAHYQLLDNFGSTIRFAYVDNPDGVYSPLMKAVAITLGGEYKPTDNSYIRIEGSIFNMSDDKYRIFTNRDGEPDKSKMEIILNFGLLLKNK